MKTVYRYEIEPRECKPGNYSLGCQGKAILHLPLKAKIISCLAQPFVSGGQVFDNAQIVIYAEVDPAEADLIEQGYSQAYEFTVQGTGKKWIVPEGSTFLGSIVCYPFYWHIYYRKV